MIWVWVIAVGFKNVASGDPHFAVVSWSHNEEQAKARCEVLNREATAGHSYWVVKIPHCKSALREVVVIEP